MMMRRNTASRLALAFTFGVLMMIAVGCGGPEPMPLLTRDTTPTVGALSTARYAPTFPDARVDLDFASEDDTALALAFAPVASAATLAGSATTPVPVPLVLMLHGMCGAPAGGCALLGDAGRADSWLVCPTGNVRCGGAHDWKGDGERKARHLDRAADAVRKRYPTLVAPPGDDVIVGFSRAARSSPATWLTRVPGATAASSSSGAALTPEPELLKASGIRRVVLASGDHDSARSTMIRATAKLIRGGVEARFVSTGPIWHQLPDNLAEILAPHMAWVRAG